MEVGIIVRLVVGELLLGFVVSIGLLG